MKNDFFGLKELEKDYYDKKKGDENDFKMELDDFLKVTIDNCNQKQIEIINSKENKYIVSGTAGSGKSLLAMRNALDLFNKNEDFRIIIYTKTLKKYLLGRLKKANLGNIDKFIICGDVLKTNAYKGSDYIIIDEVQDFKMTELDEMFAKTKKGFYLYGDDGQQIFPKKTLNTKIVNKIITEKNIKWYELFKTYRFPKKIALFCEKIKIDGELLSDKCLTEGVDENKPKLIEFKDVGSQIRYIADVLKNEEWKSVGILVKRNKDVKKVIDKLMDEGIMCDYKYDYQNKTIEELDFSNDRPKVMTYHSSKGLEFERVFVPSCDVYDQYNKYNYREALYVACTRAQKTLIISYIDGEKSPYLNGIDDKFYKFEMR